MKRGVCILAGGESRRMGGDKSMAVLHGETLLELALEKASGLGLPVVVSSGRRVLPGVDCVLDTKGRGPMAGLCAVLQVFYRVLLFPVDMPFLSLSFLAFLLDEGRDTDILVCEVGGKLQPQVGVYSGECLPFLHERLDRGDFAFKGLLQEPVKKRILGEDDVRIWGDPIRIFFNINTPGDLERASEIMEMES